ncbi:MAG: hypothetical protein LAP39_18895 [Acidobacteriia bacterium]|nr:hypothetical protein [Terriglobia bacterium]
MARHARIDESVLEMALIGYQAEKTRIETVMAEIREQLGHRGPGRPKAASDGTGQASPRRRVMSAEARKRIAAAQRKRWAAVKSEKAKPEKPKRKLSAAGRKAIVAALRKRWAAVRKAAGKTKKAAPTAAAKEAVATA